ncbi:autorepressor SdpR family transcription factor [Clostridium arbusti]|uniref:autorepressor SdpR family transcription factor n=1 Tax=Clostridium arbusti TaxID=1137848 RepID=UPI000289A9DE|nr:winged helix-turn-helix domain-containing protein [Clostridium arbusti]
MSIINLSFKALADPTRRKIIILLKEKDLTAGEIAEHFNMTKPSISHHLNALKQASLVTDERKGQNIYYSLNTTVLQEVTNWFFNVTHVNEGGTENEKNS